MLGLIPHQQQGNRTIFGGGEDNEGPEIIVPGGHKRKNAEGGEDRPHLGKDDAGINAELRGPVNAGGVHQLAREGFDELLHHKNAVRVHHRGDDQRPQRVDQAELDHEQVVGDHHHLKGDHDLDQNDAERQVFALKTILCEDVPGKRTGKERDRHPRQGHDHAVEHIPFERDGFIGQDGAVMIKGRFLRKKVGRGFEEFGGRFEGGDNDVEKRQECGDQSHRQHRIRAGFTEEPKGVETFLR